MDENLVYYQVGGLLQFLKILYARSVLNSSVNVNYKGRVGKLLGKDLDI